MLKEVGVKDIDVGDTILYFGNWWTVGYASEERVILHYPGWTSDSWHSWLVQGRNPGEIVPFSAPTMKVLRADGFFAFKEYPDPLDKWGKFRK